DIITHQVIQRAYEAGGLVSLLEATCKGTVHFTKEEMRARSVAEADATVEKAHGGAVIVDELETKVEAAARERESQRARRKEEADAQRATRERERNKRASQRRANLAARQSDSGDGSLVGSAAGRSSDSDSA